MQTFVGSQNSVASPAASTSPVQHAGLSRPNLRKSAPERSRADDQSTAFGVPPAHSSNLCHIPACTTPSPALQSKLAVNRPGDIFEQEADQVAGKVLRTQPDSRPFSEVRHTPVRTAPSEPGHTRLQTKSALAGGMGQIAAPSSVNEVLVAPGRPLDRTTRDFMEPRFGHDFSKVRVHSDAAAQESARDLSAHAYTVGNNIVFGAGRFATGTPDGQRLIAHELTHVVQQSGAGMSAGILQREHDGSTDSVTKARLSKDDQAKSNTGRFNTYVDLMNGFQDLAVAAVRRHGAGLDSVRFGNDLNRSHRLLLGQIRAVLIKAQEQDKDKRISAAAAWPALSSQLQKAVEEGRNIGLPSEALAPVLDNIAFISKEYIHAKQKKNDLEEETPEDYAHTVNSLNKLFDTFAGMAEPSPGLIREEIPNRKDAKVASAVAESNAKQRLALAVVRFDYPIISRHIRLLEIFRSALITARKESLGSAYKATVTWRSIKGELQQLLEQAPKYTDSNVGSIQQKFARTGDMLAGHYTAVHSDNIRLALTQERQPEQVMAQNAIAKGLGLKQALDETRALEDFSHALSILERNLVPSRDHAGEWILTSGRTVIRVRADQVVSIRSAAGNALKQYMGDITKVMAQASQTYDSIKLGNSSFKLHVLGGWGGASDPGDQDYIRVSVIRMRDEVVAPLVDKGKFVEAYRTIMAQRAVVESHAREVGDYDADLDTGYGRFSVAMKLLETALVSFVPAFGGAAIASGASAWAVGGTAIAAGSSGAALAETGREVASGEGVQGRKVAEAAWKGGVIAANAAAPAATEAISDMLAAGSTDALTVAVSDTLANQAVGVIQSKAAGGSAVDGFLGGTVNGVAGAATKGLGPWASQPLPQAAIQTGTGAILGELTDGNAALGAANQLAGSIGGFASDGGHVRDETPTQSATRNNPDIVPVTEIPTEPVTPVTGGAGLGSGETIRGAGIPAPSAASIGAGLKPASGETVAGASAPEGMIGGQNNAASTEPQNITLSHGTDTPGFHSLGGLGPGRIDVRHSPGGHQDFGQGFYVAEGSSGRGIAIASGDARVAQRGSGKPRQVMTWEVDPAALGDVVDVGPGGEHEQLWKEYLNKPLVEGRPASGTVGEYIRGLGIEHRGEYFDKFLLSIGKQNADAVRGPIGTPETSGIAAPHESVQWAIRSQRAADHLNAMMGDPPSPTSPPPESGPPPSPASGTGNPPTHTTPPAATQHSENTESSTSPIHEINEPNKAKGTLAELAVPFGPYSGSEWNHIGGGSESGSSRQSLARRSSHDERMNAKEGTAGNDFLVENVKTGRLVIGEQKATNTDSFVGASAITTSLETNIQHNVDTLTETIKTVKDPVEVARLQKTIDRLKATGEALKNGREGKPAELPEGVVFELTNIGGEGKQIGKEHINLLAEKYGKNPAFLEHLLDRTFVRDAELAKQLPQEKARNPEGQRGTDADPDIVPAKDILTAPAEDRLAQLRSGKSEKQWAAKKAREQAAADKAAQTQKNAQKKELQKQRADEKKLAEDQAKEIGEQARQEHLRLEEKRKQETASPEQTEKERGKAARKTEREAKKAGKDAEKAHMDKFQADRKAQDDQARDARRASEQAQSEARKQEREARRKELEAENQQREASNRRREAANKRREADKQKKEAESQQGKSDNQQRDDSTQQSEAPKPHIEPDTVPKAPEPTANNENITLGSEKEPGTTETPESVLKLNDDASPVGARQEHGFALSKGTHLANQGAAAVRGIDAYQDDIDKGKGRIEASADAVFTYAANSNPLVGAVSTIDQRIQKDANGQQYYGNDEVDAFLGTAGETVAGFLIPGSRADQAINAGANLFGAVDDHLHRGQDPNSQENKKATLRTGVDLAAELTPARAFASTIGAGLRSYYDVGQAIGGNTRGVDKFADDGVRGKLGSVLQPWAMAADFVGNLGSDSAGVALEKTIKKTEGTTLKKIGDAAGDAVFNLSQSKKAKSGKYGSSVQGVSAVLGITSDVIAGKSFEKALNDAADAGKGSLADTVGSAAGDLAFNAVQKGKELINEDIPAAKEKAVQAIDKTKEAISDWWHKL